jgi:Bacterial PH domain
MAIEQTRAQVIGSIWQAIAQSEVDISAVPRDQQEKLVGKIADNVMMAIDAMLEPAQAPVEDQPAESEHEERVLWQGRPFLSMVESYVITSERIKIVKGLLSRGIENFELIRIQDIDAKQGLDERILGIGDIVIRGQDPSNPEIILRNIPKPNEVYELLRRAWLDARKRYGLQFREYM